MEELCFSIRFLTEVYKCTVFLQSHWQCWVILLGKKNFELLSRYKQSLYEWMLRNVCQIVLSSAMQNVRRHSCSPANSKNGDRSHSPVTLGVSTLKGEEFQFGGADVWRASYRDANSEHGGALRQLAMSYVSKGRRCTGILFSLLQGMWYPWVCRRFCSGYSLSFFQKVYLYSVG